MTSQSIEKYTLPARILHWLVALGIISAFAIIMLTDDGPLTPTKLRMINYHKWMGITVLALAILRVLWRATHRPPALPAHMSALEQRVAHGGHLVLYLLMLAVPLCGWAFSSARGYPVVWLGLVPLPDLVAKNKELAHTLHEMHEIGGWSVIVIAGLHALAALKHHFISRDDTLKRML